MYESRALWMGEAGRQEPVAFLGRSHCLLRNVSVALLVVVPLFLSTTTPSVAIRTTYSLPTLRLDYYAYSPNLEWFLDPSQAGCTDLCPVGALQVLSLVQANLVKVLPNGKPVPDLAHWKVSENKKFYTFTIRKDARFANGHRVTAHDVAFSLRRSLAPVAPPAVPSTAWVYLGSLIQGAAAYRQGKTHALKGVTVLDGRTLRITLTKPAAYFLVLLSFPSEDVLDRTVMAGKSASGNPKSNYLTKTCIANQGAGPFRFVCRDSSSRPHSFFAGGEPTYRLVPNRYYYGPKPHIKIELPRILLKSTDINEEYKRYLENKIDVSRIPPPFLRRWVSKTSQYHAYPAPAISYLIPNVHLVPFNNVHCRLALAYAINRKVLASNVGNGTATPSYTVVPKGLLGSYDGKDNPHYNPKKARAELAKCPGRAARIGFRYRPDRLEEEAVGEMLRTVGMNVVDEPNKQDWENAIGQSLGLVKTNTELAWTAWQADYPDPQDFCTVLLRSDQFGDIGGWHNAAYDRLVDQADVTVNPKQRALLYIRAQHIAVGKGAMVTETQGLAPFLTRPTVHGLVGGPAYSYPVARGLNWANVSLGKH